MHEWDIYGQSDSTRPDVAPQKPAMDEVPRAGKGTHVKCRTSPTRGPRDTASSQIARLQKRYSSRTVFAKCCSADTCLGDYKELTVTQRLSLAQSIHGEDEG